jgi:protein-arginine kinase activator protein McsA
LNEAVERENYEKAAELRDKIYELSGNVEDGD